MSAAGYYPRLTLFLIAALVLVAVVLANALYATTIDTGLVEGNLREKNGIYAELVADACPASEAWLAAYRNRGIVVEFEAFSVERHALPVSMDGAEIRSVLRRPDRAADKFGDVVGFFDANGCMLVE